MNQTMSKNFDSVLTKEKGYDYLNQILRENVYSKVFVLTDTNVSQFCLPVFLRKLSTELDIEVVEVDHGEAFKTIETCIELWKLLLEYGADRKSMVINLGGGVITDLGGFVASSYKRGIEFVHVPTTLLAMVDAAIGGKNGVDFEGLKNQIGTIQLPNKVIIDSEFLTSLSKQQMRSGLAEMFKHGLIYDSVYWNQLKGLSNLTGEDLDELIYRSVEIKQEITNQDPLEKGLRKALNFGHTIGHAIESFLLDNPEKFTLLHGEAVALGMVAESYISFQMNLIDQAAYQEIKDTLLGLYLPQTFTLEQIHQMIDLMSHDKKNEFGQINFTLLESIGKCVVNQVVNNDLIVKSFDEINCP